MHKNSVYEWSSVVQVSSNVDNSYPTIYFSFIQSYCLKGLLLEVCHILQKFWWNTHLSSICNWSLGPQRRRRRRRRKRFVSQTFSKAKKKKKWAKNAIEKETLHSALLFANCKNIAQHFFHCIFDPLPPFLDSFAVRFVIFFWQTSAKKVASYSCL